MKEREKNEQGKNDTTTGQEKKKIISITKSFYNLISGFLGLDFQRGP